MIGLQFHLEVTENSIKQMIIFRESELTTEKYIQTVQEMSNQKEFLKDNNQRMFLLLNYLATK